jgi:hypothetical protein
VFCQHRQTRPCLLSLPEQTKEPEIIAAYMTSGQISLAKTGRLHEDPHETRLGEMTNKRIAVHPATPFEGASSSSARIEACLELHRRIDSPFSSAFMQPMRAT